jgi:hypothetical protein
MEVYDKYSVRIPLTTKFSGVSWLGTAKLTAHIATTALLWPSFSGPNKLTRRYRFDATVYASFESINQSTE